MPFASEKIKIQITEIIATGVEIRAGDIALIRTDMHKLWKTPRGHDRPVLSIEATKYLVEDVGIHCIGTDATGLEVRGRNDQPCIPCCSSTMSDGGIADEPRPPPLHALEIIILPLMVEGMDSCPVRVIALEEETR